MLILLHRVATIGTTAEVTATEGIEEQNEAETGETEGTAETGTGVAQGHRTTAQPAASMAR